MPQTILLIQNDDNVARTVREALSSPGDDPFQVEWVKSCAAALERLAIEDQPGAHPLNPIAAVLVDLMLTDCQGIETFERVFGAAPHIPLLVLCTLDNEDIAKSAVRNGAQDYLLTARLDRYLLPKALRNMMDRAANAEALFAEKERAEVTLNSIGDAVMSSDLLGNVTYLNAVAEAMTGWSRHEAAGRPLEEVFRIIDATSRAPARNPMALAMRSNKTMSLTPNCVLIRRDGVEASIEDSAAPIHDRRGRVAGAVMVFHDVSATRALSQRMAHLAQHDSLTDLPNRCVLSDRLHQVISMAHRRRHKLALLFVDLDRFKHINDSLGHDVGDRVLKAVAQRLRSCVRESDTVSRQGGDEFVVLLAEIARTQDAALCAQKILAALSAPLRIGQHSLYLTASIGIVTSPQDGTDVDTLMKNADFAMYHAKETGRSNYQFFAPEMNVRALEWQTLENGLRHAIDRQELVLHFQPIFNLRTLAVTAVEALIRWNHPQRGLILPAQFVPVAEESGFVVAIGRWVLREACSQARSWQDAGLPFIRMAINVSAVELRDRDFVSGVAAALRESELAAGTLELELTETFLMQDWATTAPLLQALRDIGVRLALDDFGTGYSSLSHLKRFPIDTLKIDRSFVRDVGANTADAAIAGLVIGLGNSLDIRVVAEGVETAGQLASLRALGCPEAQGYYFGAAVAAEDFTQHLRSLAAPVCASVQTA